MSASDPWIECMNPLHITNIKGILILILSQISMKPGTVFSLVDRKYLNIKALHHKIINNGSNCAEVPLLPVHHVKMLNILTVCEAWKRNEL